MPTVERPQYVQKLLEILGSPSNVIIKLTTYRREWIPDEVYEEPEQLKGKEAWVVCVDTKRSGGNYTVQGFIPVREVKIVKVKKDSDNLVLWLETHEYLRCDNYQEFSSELTSKIQSKKQDLPPARKSYIVQDIAISTVKVVDSNEDAEVNEAWKRIINSVSSIDTYRNAVFYRILGISKDSSYLKTENSQETDEGDPQNFYQLTVNETYKLQIHYFFPERQFEHCPQYIKISANGWVRVYGECKMNDRVGDSTVLLKPIKTSDQHPYEHIINLSLSVESGQLFAPQIRLPIIFVKEKRRTTLRRNARVIGSSGLFLAIFFVGQILPSIYQNIYNIPTSVIGPALSTLAITLVSLVFADIWKRSPTEKE
jgi:hypothetical protein